jgi:class 3 adenylate cyclase
LAAAAAPAPKKSEEPQIRVTDASAPENLEGERKTVTALFADIKGSMELMEDIDPEKARAIVDPALKLMIDAVNRYGGHVVQSTGDGVFALFGASLAHEDHPQRALYAAPVQVRVTTARLSGFFRLKAFTSARRSPEGGRGAKSRDYPQKGRTAHDFENLPTERRFFGFGGWLLDSSQLSQH